MGATNLIEGQIVSKTGEQSLLKTSIGDLLVSQPTVHPVGATVLTTVRPEHIDLLELESPNPNPNLNSLRGVVGQVVYFGGALSYQVKVGSLVFKVMERSTRVFQTGQEVIVRLNPKSLWIFPERNVQ
jgi:ABC-type sugar transport system ATPase subunit